ncbi:beta-ketoacyl synthase N-terminal-like domain-containing protein [Xenorhabdus budapestensis]|uniref:beta-ketoacyl synthase N-terminal-like domain-containing protein n=1 Tax=Xenorhabdus budapestensis TaxID=290110 RepID=UPI003A85881D
MNNFANVRDKDIAIIGMAGRFPGAEDITTYWRNLLDGLETITTFTEAELRASDVDEELMWMKNLSQRRTIFAAAGS